jgi:hypothetical protein
MYIETYLLYHSARILQVNLSTPHVFHGIFPVDDSTVDVDL